MVRPVTPRAADAWKAALAVAVIAGGLLWHVLACTESPMAFSPGGKDLAFVLTQPYGKGMDKEGLVRGEMVFRLMVLSEGRPVRILEETADALLSAPAYSPDGRRLAYLRIPLLDAETAGRVKALADERAKALDPDLPDLPADLAAALAPPPPAGEPAPTELEFPDAEPLPSVSEAADWLRQSVALLPVKATLVVRDAATDAVVSTARLPLPLARDDLLITYLTLRPAWGQDGAIYMCVANVAFAIDPAAGKARALAAPVAIAALSPDGKTVAAVGEKVVAFLQTDGQAATYRRWEQPVSLSGLAWLDAETVALLEAEKGQPPRLHLLRRDGRDTKAVALDLPATGLVTEGATGQLALAPDGRHMVLAYKDDVFFLDTSGKVLKHWHGQDEPLAQPTFTPDSRRVAFKHFAKAKGPDESPVPAIVFYTPDGKEVSRTEIPPTRLKLEPPEEKPGPKPADEQTAPARDKSGN